MAGINVFVATGSHTDTFHLRRRQQSKGLVLLGFPVPVKVESTAVELNPPGLVFPGLF